MAWDWSYLDPTSQDFLNGALGGSIGDMWDDISGTTAAETQADAIEAAAAEDRAYLFPNAVGPLGSQTVTRDPVTGEVTVNTALSAEQQALVSGLRGQLGQGGQNVGDALYQQATSRLDPQWAQREDAARTRLYNMGLREGDAAFDRQMSNMGMERTDAYNQAQLSASRASGQEQSRLLNALVQQSNPGLATYWGTPNAAAAATAGANLMSGATNPLEAIIAAYGAWNS